MYPNSYDSIHTLADDIDIAKLIIWFNIDKNRLAWHFWAVGNQTEPDRILWFQIKLIENLYDKLKTKTLLKTFIQSM